MNRESAEQVMNTLMRIEREVADLSRLVAAESGLMCRVEKRCNQCTETRSMGQFFKNRSSPDGRCSICKYCISANRKKARAA